jgi:hypothetical protein
LDRLGAFNSFDAAKFKRLKLSVDPLYRSAERWWGIVEAENSPLWAALAAGAVQLQVSQERLELAVDSLRSYPIDLIDWGFNNSNRWDCTLQPYNGYKGSEKIGYKVVPPMVKSSPLLHF